MHGINRSLLRSLDAKVRPVRAAAARPAAAPPPDLDRLRNLLRPPREGETFSADGRVALALSGTDRPLRVLMRKVAARIGREQWTTAIRPDVDVSDNPLIPAGYTYLLQLVAHDMAHSSLSLAGSLSGALGRANTRLFPLTLETIYGGGPDVSPQAYELDRAHRDHISVVPRTRFRLGQVRNPNRTTTDCPFRDIGRAVPANVQDGGLEPDEKLELGRVQDEKRALGLGEMSALDPTSDPWRTEALIADPRNDDHALISQLTAVFHALHNLVIDMIPEDGALAAYSAPERAYRRFLCAQSVVTLLYRNILVKDLLALILHPDVYDLYTGENPPKLDDEFPGRKDDVPVEFTSAVFRFAHSMVRDEYKVNSEIPRPFGVALTLGSVRLPGNLPVDTSWVVDWSRFFKICDREPNFSRRIGPVYAGPLTDSAVFKPLTADDTDGLPDRDLVTGSYAGLWSVPALCRELRARNLGHLVPDYEHWKPIVRAWLAKPAAMVDLDPLSDLELDDLANDPPLLLFALLEAAQPITQPTAAVNGAAGESLHLGAVGSIIVAETVLGALARNPIAFETAGPHVRDRIRAASQELLDDPGVLDAIPEIASMAELIELMIKAGALPGPIFEP